MIEIHRCFDYDLLSTIANQPHNYSMAADDFSPKMGEYRVVSSDLIYYLMAQESLGETEQSLLGVGIFVPENHVLYQSHIFFMPAAYGRTDRCVSPMFEWMWKHTDARKITGSIPRFNRLALKLALRVGMKLEGVNSRSFLKGGILYDQIRLGISRP